MTSYSLQPELAPAIRQVLDALRRRIRWYVWLEGLGWAVAWLGAAFWASLAIDRYLEPTAAVRQILAVIVGLVLAWVLFRGILRRAFVPLRDPSMALLLERYFPQFGDSLLTAVDLSEGDGTVEGLSSELLARTCRDAAGPLGEVRLPKVFNPWPLRKSVGAAAALLSSVVLFGLLQSHAMGIWARRSLLFAEESWPRTTHLLMEGFQDGSIKILRGTGATVVCTADRGDPNVPERVYTVPERVYVDYIEGGARKSKPMRRQRDADPEKSRYQRFSYAFESVVSPITFDVAGGDDAIRGLRIEVVDNPAIVTMEVDCEYPPYTGRTPKSFPMTNVMQFPWGSRITVRATTNKNLVQVRVEQQQETGPRRKPSEEPSAVAIRPSPENPRSFRHAIGTLTKETTVLFTLFDADGIRSREPVPLTLAAVEDERPRLSVRLQGIGTAGAAIAPRAMLPAAGQVTDDYGIARVWFEYAVDQKPAATKQIAALSGNLTEYPLKLPEALLDAAGLDLKPGQKFSVCVKAEDRFNLGSGPNVGSGDRWVLDVVTPQQLQTMLKARQLVLRQRFEETIKKVEYTRNLLAGLDFSPPKKPAPPKDPAAKRAEPKSGEKAAAPKPESGAEAPSAAERLALRTLDVRSAAENSVTDAHEVLGLAEAFSEIRQELVNNRIDDEEGKRRLQDEIAVPLRRIGSEMFAELDRQLDRLQETIADAAKGAESRDQTVRQADAILLAMRQALGKMSRLEDLNEVIETLRAIIRAQEKVQVLTKQRQKESLTELKEKLP
jgi:hypothetical protein